MKTCAIYARYSSDSQRTESIADQITQCRKFAEVRNFKVLEQHIYFDEAVSGEDISREGYRALRTAAAAQMFDYIVVDDLSRLGRNAGEAISVYDELTFLNVHIASLADGTDTASTGSRAPYLLKSFMNDLFLEDLRNKVRRGLKGQVRRGYSAGGRVYGYRSESDWDPSGATDRFGRPRRFGVRVKIEPTEADVVRRIFQWSSEGLGLKSICARLNEGRVPSPHSGASRNPWGSWCVGTVRTILYNPKYIGDWTYNRTQWIKKPGTSKRKRIPRPESDWVEWKDENLRIIEQPIWDAVQARLAKRAASISRGPKGRLLGSTGHGGHRKYMLSGLLKCGDCGANLVAHNSAGSPVYICNNYWTRGRSVCTNNTRLHRPSIERQVVDQFKARLSDTRAFDHLHKDLCAAVESYKREQQRKGRKREKAQDLENQIGRLLAFLEDHGASDAVAMRLREKELELARVRSSRVGEPEAVDKPVGIPLPSLDWFNTQVKNLHDVLAKFPSHVTEARELLTKYLTGPIVMKTRKNEEKTLVEGRAKGNPLNVLQLGVFPYSVVAAQGFEPRTRGL